MKSSKQPVWALVMGVLVILLAVGVVVLLLLWLADVVKTLDAPKAAIFVSLVGVLGIFLTQSLTGYWNRKLEKERAQLARRTEVYESLVRSLTGMLTAKGDAGKRDEHFQKMLDFSPQVIVWGSGPVLNAWNHFRYRLMSVSEKPFRENEFLKITADLLKAIREDLGHKDRNKVFDSDLLRPFINDAEAGQNYSIAPSE
ncbi:hypothetical protein [Arthrobacter sp. S41]|uniref:hypothetical protein n=1 Tax=Arthrobacter sp. S41 TaxID=2509721 RepID=UPI0010358E26|nr:hypothetical protein [Arthrobacter sp. S41]TAP27835.1 hypothetical protein EYR88_05795 [Arthrobacter sp. S41]